MYKFTYQDILENNVVPDSTLTINIRKIYPLLKFSNIYHLLNRVEEGEVSRVKVLEVVGFQVTMNENCLAYIGND